MVTLMRSFAFLLLTILIPTTVGCNIDDSVDSGWWNIYGLYMGPGVLQGQLGEDDGVTWDGQGIVPKELFSSVANLGIDARWDVYEEVYRKYEKILVHPQPYATGSTMIVVGNGVTMAGETYELTKGDENWFYVYFNGFGGTPYIGDDSKQIDFKVYDYQWPTDEALAEFSVEVSWQDCTHGDGGITTDVGSLTNYAVIRVAGSCDPPK